MKVSLACDQIIIRIDVRRQQANMRQQVHAPQGAPAQLPVPCQTHMSLTGWWCLDMRVTLQASKA
jgi:hypothetical protein